MKNCIKMLFGDSASQQSYLHTLIINSLFSKEMGIDKNFTAIQNQSFIVITTYTYIFILHCQLMLF